MRRSFVVTGGVRGVGRAIAERLSQDGKVVVVDLDPTESPLWEASPPWTTSS
jgi:NAD(P)-dependent dehydrogenase (short-subunit alcohol dehydrogenase family)